MLTQREPKNLVLLFKQMILNTYTVFWTVIKLRKKNMADNEKTATAIDSMGPLAIAGVEPYQEQPGEEYMNEKQKAHFKRS